MDEQLNELRETAEIIYEMTAEMVLTGQPDNAEQEIEAYALLMDKREPLINKLAELLKQTDIDNNRDVKHVISKIVTLDKENYRIMEHIRESVKSSMKDARSEKKLYKAYSHPMEDYTHSLLDTKK